MTNLKYKISFSFLWGNNVKITKYHSLFSDSNLLKHWDPSGLSLTEIYRFIEIYIYIYIPDPCLLKAQLGGVEKKGRDMKRKEN